MDQPAEKGDRPEPKTTQLHTKLMNSGVSMSLTNSGWVLPEKAKYWS
jgi:hypothetical protein